MQLVQSYSLLSGTPADFIAAGAVLLLVVCVARRWKLASGRDSARYYPDLAWLTAFAYFSLALLLSWSLGVMQALISLPLVAVSQLQSLPWIAFTLFYLVVLWVGYGLLWPKGTFTDGRQTHPLLTTLYGLVWGLCHGQVFLSIWAIAEMTGLNSYWVAAITYIVLSGYNAVYHQFFWDIKVSPPHNYESWNMKKVAFCHAPNLLLGLTWLAIWGNFGLWLLFQTACLVISAHGMRFPAPGDDYTAVAGMTKP